MSIIAAGAYLRVLRDHHRLSQRDVADALHVGRKAIVDWESGRHIPNAVDLACYLDYLRGSAVQVHDLLVNNDATAEDGEAMARLWIASSGAAPDGNGNDERQVYQLAAAIRRLTPRQLRMLLALELRERSGGDDGP